MSLNGMQYAIVLRDNPAKATLSGYLSDILQALNFEVSVPENSPCLILLKASVFDLEAQAEHLKVRKPVAATGELQEFDVATRKGFANIDTDSFWLPFEEACLTRVLLNHVRTDDTFGDVIGKLNATLKTEDWMDQPLLEVCHRLKLLSHVGPLHKASWLSTIWRQNKHRMLLMDLPPIRNYFGERVAFYFAWMNFMQLWLLVPALFSLSIWMWPASGSSDGGVAAGTYIPLYSAFMVVWGVLGAKFWQRTSNSLAWQWDTAQRMRSEEVRPEFKGQVRVSPVTGEKELYFWAVYRLPLYCLTSIITAALVSTTLLIMISMLNLQGVVRPEDKFLFIETVGGLARPGQLFDPDGMLSVVVLIIRTATILLFKQLVYIPCVQLMTNMENHRTPKAHTNSMIFKRYLFDAADRYLPLLYLALCRSDTTTVQKEFQMLYLIDTLRRVATETIVPMLKIRIKVLPRNILRGLSGKKAQLGAEEQAMMELKMPVYEDFNDFLEMVVEFGYITMFAAAYPPAAFISLLVHMLEVRSDLFKLTHIYRRPEVVRASSIGTWQWLVEAQAWLSVLTNAILLVFTGPHLPRWLPSWFSQNGSKPQEFSIGSRLVVVMVMEHLLLLVMLLFALGIPDEPEEVRMARRRMEYLQEKTFLRTQQQQRCGLLAAMSLKRRELENLTANAAGEEAQSTEDASNTGWRNLDTIAATLATAGVAAPQLTRTCADDKKDV